MSDQPIREGAESAEGVEGASDSRMPTRRQVVLGAAFAVGAVALSSPLWHGLISSLAASPRPAVGVVAPPSTRYRDLLAQLEAGVRRGLATGGRPDVSVVARASANSAPSSVAVAARELIERDKVDLVLVYANPTQVDLLGALSKSTGVPVVVVDPGAQIVTPAETDSRVLSHSLGHWQSSWSLGEWSVGAVGPKAHVISSLYESGFDILNAFDHGLTHAGGSVVGTSITHARPGDIADAVRNAAASGADSIFVAASGHEADDILHAIAKNKAASRLGLLVPGLSADRLAAASGLSAFTALTWPVAKRTAFEMLGEDVGALVAAAVAGGRSALPAGRTAMAGQRGDIQLDLASGRTDVPVRIHSVTASGGTVTFTPLAAESNTSKATAFADEIVPGLRTGWLDVYGGSM